MSDYVKSIDNINVQTDIECYQKQMDEVIHVVDTDYEIPMVTSATTDETDKVEEGLIYSKSKKMLVRTYRLKK